ncbi:MAG: protein kinase, partial [Ornithinimicrobium sp.]
MNPAPEPELRRPVVSGATAPALPGYDVRAPVRSDPPTPGVRRWRGRRHTDGLEVMLTCLDAVATPEEQMVADVVGSLSQVRHPHLVPLCDIVTWPRRPGEPLGLALVTVAAESESLDAVLRRRGALDAGQAVNVLGPVAEALAHLHERHHVHGAPTAGSVRLARNGMPFLTDLGVHQCMPGPPVPHWVQQGYVAPEVVEGFRATKQSDAYALAALVWHVLRGQPPGATDGQREPDLEQLSSRGLSPRLAEMLTQGLGSDPEERPTASEWLEALPELGPPSPLDVLTDDGNDDAAEVPRRLRAWAHEATTHGRSARHRASRPRRGVRGARTSGSRSGGRVVLH